LGLAHDAGKADPRFQEYLKAAHKGLNSPRCPHAFAGAVASLDKLRTRALLVAGHHVGIPDNADLTNIVQPNADPRTVEAARQFLTEIGFDPSPEDLTPRQSATEPLDVEFWLRMLFSCLVDADWLDTESHFRMGMPSDRGEYPAIDWYLEKLNTRLATFSGQESHINKQREEILKSCREAAKSPPGVFTLTVPTGGGKTLSGLAFALKHAKLHSRRRVVVAIPYTSIIDQTAQVYGEIFGRKNILEHHSAIDMDGEDEGSSELETKRRMASENWDCPLIVTTTVQLFESLLSNKPSRCRKLHNLADSVLIIDEVQALPEKHLGPILDVLHQLVRNYGVTLVLSTATPPDYNPVDDRLLSAATEIVADFERHFAALRRVRFKFPSEEWTHTDLVEKLEPSPQALVILNSRKDAVEVAKAASHLEGVTHMSTLLCPHHRKLILATTRQRLEDKLPVRMIATQVVEAGVDLDFPEVFRVLGPLDRIVQAAGRCNRGGRNTLGTCTVFRLADGRSPRGAYQTGIAETESLLSQGLEDITAPEVTRRYTRGLYSKTFTGSAKTGGHRALIQDLRSNLKFQSVADTFKMIEDDTVPLIVENYPGVDVGSLLPQWGTDPSQWFRKMAAYSVSVFQGHAARLQSDGLIRLHDSGAKVYTGAYHPMLGLAQEDLPDPSDLISQE